MVMVRARSRVSARPRTARVGSVPVDARARLLQRLEGRLVDGLQARLQPFKDGRLRRRLRLHRRRRHVEDGRHVVVLLQGEGREKGGSGGEDGTGPHRTHLWEEVVVEERAVEAVPERRDVSVEHPRRSRGVGVVLAGGGAERCPQRVQRCASNGRTQRYWSEPGCPPDGAVGLL